MLVIVNCLGVPLASFHWFGSAFSGLRCSLGPAKRDCFAPSMYLTQKQQSCLCFCFSGTKLVGGGTPKRKPAMPVPTPHPIGSL